MLLSYAKLSHKPRVFRLLLGVSVAEFDSLVAQVSPLLEKQFGIKRRPRKLASTEDKLVALLVYYRTYVTHEFIGYCVGLDNSNVSRLFTCLEPLVAKKIHIKKDRTLTEERVKELLIDATEQPTQRPKSKKARQSHYSGKKKRHTLKTEMVMDTEGCIINLSHSSPGRVHDFKLRQQSAPLPPNATKYVDLGYRGLDKLSNHVKLPHKKPQGSALTGAQKKANQAHSRIRIAIEHKFAELKKFRILSDIYRNFRKKHHMRFNIIAGIVNLQHGF